MCCESLSAESYNLSFFAAVGFACKRKYIFTSNLVPRIILNFQQCFLLFSELFFDSLHTVKLNTLLSFISNHSVTHLNIKESIGFFSCGQEHVVCGDETNSFGSGSSSSFHKVSAPAPELAAAPAPARPCGHNSTERKN